MLSLFKVVCLVFVGSFILTTTVNSKYLLVELEQEDIGPGGIDHDDIVTGSIDQDKTTNDQRQENPGPSTGDDRSPSDANSPASSDDDVNAAYDNADNTDTQKNKVPEEGNAGEVNKEIVQEKERGPPMPEPKPLTGK